MGHGPGRAHSISGISRVVLCRAGTRDMPTRKYIRVDVGGGCDRETPGLMR